MSISFDGDGNELHATPIPITGLSFGKWIHITGIIPEEKTMEQRTKPNGMTLKEWREWRWSEHQNECLGWSKVLSNEEIVWMEKNKQ